MPGISTSKSGTNTYSLSDIAGHKNQITEATFDKMTTQVPISSLSARGISALKALVETLDEEPGADPDTRSLVSSLLTRFKLWVGNLGAHRASGTRSLEYKLRDASMLRNHVVSLLQDLCVSIDEAFALVLAGDTLGDGNESDGDRDSLDEELEKLWTDEGQDPDERSDLDLALSGIQNAVDCLLRLSATIRNPAPHDHFKSRAAAAYGGMFELADKNHISEKYNHLDQVVVERLAKSMARRRQYFRYREEHASRIAHGVEDIVEGVECDDVSEYTANQTTISSLPGHLKDEALAATVAEMDAFDDLDDAQSQASETSYAATDVNSTELRVPRPPPEYIHGPFKCPFCHMIITIENKHQWKKHVFRDLQPYNCLYNSCRMPHQQFSRRSQWIEHMRREHWRVWHCSLGCASATFDSAKQLIDHNKSAHAANLQSSSDEDGHMALSSVPDISKARGPCPLCLEVTIATDKIYGKHVGDHLERLALFVLPRVDYEDASDDDDFQDDSNDDDDDNDASDGEIDNNGQPTTSNEVKPRDSSNTSSQQPRQPDGPQEPQQADKRKDWESYLHRQTGLPGDDLDNDMYAESSSQQPTKPGIVSRNRTRDPDAPPTYTAATVKPKKKSAQEEWKQWQAEPMKDMDKLMAKLEAFNPSRRAALEEVNRNMFKFKPVVPPPVHNKTRSLGVQPQGNEEFWIRPPPSPTASGSGEGSGSYATRDSGAVQNPLDRSRPLANTITSSDSEEYEHESDQHSTSLTAKELKRLSRQSVNSRSPPTQVTQDADKGMKKDEKKSQGFISSLFSKKKKTLKQEPAQVDPYAGQYDSPGSTGTRSSTSDDGH